MDIPSIEPVSIRAGDTMRWQRSLPDYPASAGWVLSYVWVSATQQLPFDATAAGDDHVVDAAAGYTALLPPGDYTWQAYVSKDSDRFTVGSGRVTVLPDLSQATSGLDGRSQARRILDGLMAAYESYVGGVNGRGHVAEYEIAGRKMKFRTAEEILQQIDHWKREVAREDQAAALAAGRRPGRVYTRFGR